MDNPKRCVGPLTLVTLALLAGCAPLLAPTVESAPAATETPAQTVTPLPTATLEQVQEYELTAWPAMYQPRLDEIQTIYVQLTRGGEGVAGASAYAVAHYQGGDRRYPAQGYETTGDDGIASLSFAVYDAGAEYPVSVDVHLLYGEIALQEAVSYTPTC
jgi:hypothetical protein